MALAQTAPYTPFISYHDLDGGDIRFAYRTGGGWVTETVTNAYNSTLHTSLALDSADNPHITYEKWGYIAYARRTGTGWATETVARVRDASLALDSADQPHIGYYDGDDLYYAYRDGSTWITETVDALGDVGQNVSLALDGAGRPRIAYHDDSNADLKFAWQVRVDVIPPAGGTLGAYGSATLAFPAGAVTDTIVLTYTVLQPWGAQPGVGIYFDLSVVYATDGRVAQIAPGQTYTIIVHYDEANVPLGVNESDLALYYWDSATSTAIKEPTSVVDAINNTVTATPNHFSLWAILAPRHEIYLPVTLRNVGN
jgi:hypothetical protein